MIWAIYWCEYANCAHYNLSELSLFQLSEFLINSKYILLQTIDNYPQWIKVAYLNWMMVVIRKKEDTHASNIMNIEDDSILICVFFFNFMFLIFYDSSRFLLLLFLFNFGNEGECNGRWKWKYQLFDTISKVQINVEIEF